MSTTVAQSTIQLIRRGDLFAVRTKGLFGLWWYWDAEGCCLWPGSYCWGSEGYARRRYDELREQANRSDAIRNTPTTVVDQS